MLSHHLWLQHSLDDLNMPPILIHNYKIYMLCKTIFTIIMLKVRVKIYGPSHKLFRQLLHIIVKYFPTPTSDLYSILPHKNNVLKKRN
jgi:hypothetical protein